MTGHSPPGREQAPGWQSEGSSKNNTDSHIVSDDRERTRDLRLGYQVGYGTGYHIGYAHGWHASDDEWQALLGVLQVVLSEPRHTELETARQPSDAPCPTRCRTCARCARHAVVHSNLRRYGTADFPGRFAVVTRAKTKTVSVRALGSNTTEFDGPGVIDAIKTLGVPYMRSRHGKAWQVSGRHADDLMALLEHRHYRLVVTL